MDDLITTAVIPCDIKDQLIIFPCEIDRLPDLLLQFIAESFKLTQVAQLHTIFMQRIQFPINDVLEDINQAPYLRLRASPVFRGEGVNR